MVQRNQRSFRLMVTLFALLGFGVSSEAQPRSDDLSDITIHMRWVEMSTMSAWKLLKKFPPSKMASDILYREAQKLVDAGEAKVIEHSYIRTSRDQSSQTEQVEEFPYLVEAEPDLLIARKESPLILNEAPFGRRFLFSLTEAGGRNTGIAVEVKPAFKEESDVVDIEIAADIVEFGRYDFPDPILPKTGAPNPIFHTMSVQSNVTAPSGHQLLLAAHTPSGKDGSNDYSRKILVFVRVDTGIHPNSGRFDAALGSDSTLMVEWIELEKKLLMDLKLRYPEDEKGLKKEIDQLVSDGRASIREIGAIRSRFEALGKVESVEEFIYPTEVRVLPTFFRKVSPA